MLATCGLPAAMLTLPRTFPSLAGLLTAQLFVSMIWSLLSPRPSETAHIQNAVLPATSMQGCPCTVLLLTWRARRFGEKVSHYASLVLAEKPLEAHQQYKRRRSSIAAGQLPTDFELGPQVCPSLCQASG